MREVLRTARMAGMMIPLCLGAACWPLDTPANLHSATHATDLTGDLQPDAAPDAPASIDDAAPVPDATTDAAVTDAAVPPIDYPSFTAVALVRILDLHQLAASSAGSMVYRMYDQQDAACPGGTSATPSTAYATFDGACQIAGSEGTFDLAGAFRFETPRVCNSAVATPSSETIVDLAGLTLAGTSDDGQKVDLRFDLQYRKHVQDGGSTEDWTGDLRFDDYLTRWTPCCTAQLSQFQMLHGTHLRGFDVHIGHDAAAGDTYSGVLDIAGEGTVAVSTPIPLAYQDACWKPKSGTIRFDGTGSAEIRFGYLPGAGTGTDACTNATNTSTWWLDGVEQGPIAPNFWGSLTICGAATSGSGG